jgi:hypothetical protein
VPSRTRAALALLLAAALAGCAVKGYELGWRDPDRIAPLLGRPLDALAGCRSGQHGSAPGAACARLVREIEAMAAALPPTATAPEALGARCGGDACSYANVYERRDVGIALVVPVFRKIVLREARGRFVRGGDGRWRLDALSVTDLPPPGYGPVRIGGSPPGA